MKQLLIIIAAVALASCGGPRVISSESAPGIDLSNYKTFDFYKIRASGDTLPDKFSARTAMIEKAIEAQLIDRGFTRNANPDLLVNIGIVVAEKVQTRMTDIRTDAPMYIGQRNYRWKSEEVEVGRYRLGTATMDLVDARTNSLVWESVVEDVIPDKDSKVEATIAKGVERMFSKFPK